MAATAVTAATEISFSKKVKIPPCAIRRTVYHMQSALGEGAAAGPQGRGRGDGPERISKKVLDKTGADL